MTTTITVNGTGYTISNDKVQHIVSLLQAYQAQLNIQQQQQVREILNNHPNNDGRVLING